MLYGFVGDRFPIGRKPVFLIIEKLIIIVMFINAIIIVANFKFFIKVTSKNW